jgi:hypothetical protein
MERNSVALLSGVLLFAITTAAQGEACSEESASYAVVRTVDNADAVIACLEMALGSVPFDVAVTNMSVPDTPVVGPQLHGTPQFDMLQRRMEELKRRLDLTDSVWSALMTSTISSGDAISLVIQDDVAFPGRRAIDIYGRADTFEDLTGVFADPGSVQLNYFEVAR